MNNRKALSITVGIMILWGAVCFAAGSPFSDDPIVSPKAITVDVLPKNVQESVASVTQATDAQVASITRTLWSDLHRLYKESTLGRVGKRVDKKSRKAPTEHHLAKYDDLKIKIDGDNYCGQFAMSTLLNGMGIKTDPQEVYQKSNPAGIFTSPPVIVEQLRSRGIDATMKNKASLGDITKRIDQGKSVMVLVDSGDGTPHWICITGYDTNSKGEIESLRMRDSYWGVDGPHTMSVADFQKAWKSPFGKGTLGDLLTYSNLLIDNNGTMQAGSTPMYPGTFSTATEDNMASGVNDVVSGYKNRSVSQVLGGAAKLLLGLPGALQGAASNFLGKKSEGWISWGKDKMNQGGVGNKILGGAAVVGGQITNTVSKAGKVVADVWSSGATLIGNGIKKIGSWFS